SSRRRHTRSDRDWSSDVCSSDLRYGYSGNLWYERNLSLTITASVSPQTPTEATSHRQATRRARCRTRPDRSPENRSASARLGSRSEEHTSELQSRSDLVCRLLLE